MEECILTFLLEGIVRTDPLSGAFSLTADTSGGYCVMVFDRFYKPIYVTGISDDFPPAWYAIFSTPEEKSVDGCYYLEVIELATSSDPGNSDGHRVVGRAKIPWPRQTGKTVQKLYNLVAIEGYEKAISGSVYVQLRLDPIPTEEKMLVAAGEFMQA